MMNNNVLDTRKIKEGFVGQKMIVLPPNMKKMAVRNELIRKFYLTAIGFYPNAVYHDRERKHGCGQYILLYCIEGTGVVEVEEKMVKLEPNTFYILPRNIPHHYRSSETDPWSIYYVHFAGEFADYLYRRYKESNLFAVPYDEERIQSFDAIFTLVENCLNERELEACHIKLLEYVSSFIYIKELNPAMQEEDIVSHSIEYMKANLSKKLTVEDFARQQRLSVSHYSRLFRAKTGSPPNHYYNQLKVQMSCQYLYFTDRNIKEICADLGFQDPYYFSRLFKKLMGISPANYKNQHKRS